MIKVYDKNDLELQKSNLEIAKSYGAEKEVFQLITQYILKELESTNIKNPYLVKFDDISKKPLGIAQLRYRDNTIQNKIPLSKNFAHIHGMQVKKHMQRTGIGSQLLKKIDELAKVEKVQILTLCVEKDNQKAISFYEKQGFEKTDFEYRSGIHFMIKSL